MKISNLIKEKNLFWLLVLFNTLPLFCTRYFPTLDGPAHLYNAQLIHSLVFDSSSVVSHFYDLTSELLPNWTGHLLLFIFHLLLPAFIAEKLLLLLIVMGLPISFRYLLKSVSPQHVANSYLIFPFTYSALLYLGFFNFLMGLILCFFTIAYWNKAIQKGFSTQRILCLSCLFMLTYLSHVFAFYCLLLVIGIQYLQATRVNTSGKKQYSHQLLYLFLCAVIPLVLSGVYFFTRNGGGNYNYLPKMELAQMIYKITPFITFDLGKEGIFTRILFGLFLLYFSVVLVHRVKKRQDKSLLRSSDSWLLLSAIFLLFLFFLPDSNGSSSYYSLRFAFLFFLFFVLWLSFQRVGSKIHMTLFLLVMAVHTQLTIFHAVRSLQMGQNATLCLQASPYIPENSIVLPINLHENWMYQHLSNYLGADKPLILLDNYEAATGYFPVKWKLNLPDFYIGDRPIHDFQSSASVIQKHKGKCLVDFVLVLSSDGRMLSQQELELIDAVKNRYTCIYKNKLLELYRRMGLQNNTNTSFFIENHFNEHKPIRLLKNLP